MDNISFLKKISKVFDSHLINKSTDTRTLETLVVNKALQMAKRKKVYTSMKNYGIKNKLIDLYFWKSSAKRRLYHFPKAYLFAGLTEYGLAKKDNILLTKVAQYFDYYINPDGTPAFRFDKVDQVPFSMAALNLFIHFGISKYKIMSDLTFEQLKSMAEPNTKLIPYGNQLSLYVTDLLGMICPFLIKYGSHFSNEDAVKLAHAQIDYYINNGIDKETHMPFHVINRNINIKLGPVNWGRGVGWYFIALAYYSKLLNSRNTPYIRNEAENIMKTLTKLRNNESMWSQFPGSSQKFDSSATVMNMYAFNCLKDNYYNKDEIFKLLKNYIDSKGAILQSSGETRGAHIYSNYFSRSEFTQGFLLMLLSIAK